MSNKCAKHKINDVNHYKHKTPDVDCTCEGAGGSERGVGMGPATDPVLLGVAMGPAADTEINKATGPATEIK